jgi:beta-glucosidase
MARKVIALAAVIFSLLALKTAVIGAGVDSTGGTTTPYLDYTLSIDVRVADLLSRMTLDEKALLLSAGAGEIPRLGIKKYNVGSEALHGVTGPGKFTVFPQAIALASTWDTELATKVTTAISDEAWGAINRASSEWGYPGERFLSFWSPTVNMARDPRWGRTPETYGEDPYLTGRIGVAFVKGLQGNDPRYLKVVSTPKHFAANNEEHNRFRCNANISERTLREYYLPGFKACVTEGGAQSIMGAYNAVNGIPCNADQWLLTDVLRNDWGFDGYVVTDCGALSTMITEHKYAKSEKESAALAINSGVDVECGDDVLRRNIVADVQNGLVSEATVDQAMSRLLRVRFRLGMFDPPELNPYTRISPDVIGSKKHTELARQESRESIVLLRNEKVGGKPFLPIDRRQIRSVAVVGPNANAVVFGDYSGKPVNEPVTALGGIKNKVGNKVKINYVEWIAPPKVEDYSMTPAASFRGSVGGDNSLGLKAEYFANDSFEGKPVATRVEEVVNLSRGNLPSDSLKERAFTARWTGRIVSQYSGVHYFYVAAAGEAHLYVNGELIIGIKTKKQKQAFKAGNKLDNFLLGQEGEIRKPGIVMMEAGKAYDISVEYTWTKGDIQARLEWVPPVGAQIKAREREMSAIRNSDIVIAVMGLWRDLEHENIDRVDLDIPADQTGYMKQVMELNPNTTVVFINGSSISVNWIAENVPAIIEAWYPGEQGGNAIADVLFGDYNPAGRLPLTFYKSVDDLPPFDDYEVSKGRTYMYLDKESIYPFGYGLSYTTFKYSDLKIDNKSLKADGFVDVSLDVKNTGGRDGDEVVQLYARDVESSVKQPKKQLKGFKRINVKAGDTQTVSFRLSIPDLGFWDEKNGKFVVEPGKYEIQIGASSSDIRLKDMIDVAAD